VPVTATPGATRTATVTPPPAGLDLDIKNFKVTSEIELKEPKLIKIWLDIVNASRVNGKGSATVVGVQNGKEIYRMSITVFDKPGGGSTRFTFPSYMPKTAGVIIWTATVRDNNPDKDVSARLTRVKGKRGYEDHHSPIQDRQGGIQNYSDYFDRHQNG